jgi:hypothetical protein
MTDAKDVPICTCYDDWHAYNAENHAPTCPVIAAFATLTRKLNALTMHMNQVHDTLGGTDTVLTLEAAQHVVFERDALKTQLAAARMSLLAMELSRDKRLERARSTIALFASVIKSGEPWTTSCEEARTAALEARTDTRFDAVSIVDLIHEIRALRQQRDEAQARPLGYAFEVYRLLDLRDDVRAAALTPEDA